jgi:exopolysaccharide/PEP-CTERM locus tyrosine autokinase
VLIDTNALRAAGYLPEAGLERRFADHFRQIKRPLIEKAIAGDAEKRVILVTSALPGDGKTFTSLNLALSIARERDVSAILIDADGPRAHTSDLLGLKGERGFLDALANEALDVESLIVGTNVRGLEILPAGRLVDGATELLASERMAYVIKRLITHNPRRLILLDSAPLLVSSEARVLTRVPGQIVLVVRAGVTPRRAVVDAINQLDKSKFQGLVVNDARMQVGDAYYGYGEDAASTGKKNN